MASNKEHINAIMALAETLGESVETDGLNNAKLAELHSELKARAASTPAQDPAEAERVAAEKAEEEAARKAQEEAERVAAEKAAAEEKPEYVVKAGKSLITKRGIVGPGEEIKATDFAGGKPTLQAFVKSGHVGRG